MTVEQVMTELGRHHQAFLERPTFITARGLRDGFTVASEALGDVPEQPPSPPVEYVVDAAVGRVNAARRRFDKTGTPADRDLLIVALRDAAGSVGEWVANRGSLLSVKR